MAKWTSPVGKFIPSGTKQKFLFSSTNTKTKVKKKKGKK